MNDAEKVGSILRLLLILRLLIQFLSCSEMGWIVLETFAWTL
jgi:hypothetical protein